MHIRTVLGHEAPFRLLGTTYHVRVRNHSMQRPAKRFNVRRAGCGRTLVRTNGELVERAAEPWIVLTAEHSLSC